jgi:hypothetical protein
MVAPLDRHYPAFRRAHHSWGSPNLIDDNQPEPDGRIKDKAIKLLVLTGSLGLDCIFMAAWVLLNWGLEAWVIGPLAIRGFEYWILQIFRIVFAVSTGIVVIIAVVEDIITQVIKSWRQY